MINFVRGNMFDSAAMALVNTVNCVGVMGKGIAHQFSRAYPAMLESYVRDCKNGLVKIGEVRTYAESGKLIINLPTKNHWRANSKLEDIKSGLIALAKELQRTKTSSVAMPPVGCGNGGLSWNDVRPLVSECLDVPSIAHVSIEVYEPSGDFSSRIAKPPKLSLGHYILMSLRAGLQSASKLKLHKSAYWFNVYSGQSYFKFVQYKYGPYAPSLDVMSRAISDCKDFYKLDIQSLLNDGIHRGLSGRDVERLVSWSPFVNSAVSLCNRYAEDVELLATTHAVIRREGPLSEHQIVERFFNWSIEKAENFTHGDVVRAIDLLIEESLIARELHGYVTSTSWKEDIRSTLNQGDFDPLRQW